MDQLKFYKYIIGGLILLNISVLAFFIFNKPKHESRTPRENNNFQAEILKILDLNEQQKTEFKSLAEVHSQKMKTINEQQEKLLPTYFENLTNPSVQINKDRVLIQHQQLERQKLELTYEHFQDIKSLLNEDQLPHFNEFMRILTDRITNKGNRTPPPHGNDNSKLPPPGSDDRKRPPPRRG